MIVVIIKFFDNISISKNISIVLHIISIYNLLIFLYIMKKKLEKFIITNNIIIISFNDIIINKIIIITIIIIYGY